MNTLTAQQAASDSEITRLQEQLATATQQKAKVDADLTWWRKYSDEVKQYHAARDLPVPTDDESGNASSGVGTAAAAPNPAASTQAGRPQEATAVLAAEIQAFSWPEC